MKTVLLAALVATLATPALAAHASHPAHKAHAAHHKAQASHQGRSHKGRSAEKKPREAKAETLTGDWTMSDGSKDDCKLKLSAKGASGGAVDPSSACIRTFPRLKTASAWAVESGGRTIEIVDHEKHRIYRFEKDGDAFVTALNKDDQQFTLSRKARAPELSTRERMSGDWSVTGAGGKPRCAFRSKSNKAGSEGILTAKPSSTCTPKWRAVGWTGWRLKGETLELLGPKGKVTHTLKAAESTRYEGETKAGAPLYFGRD